jgi:hypothetical protein
MEGKLLKFYRLLMDIVWKDISGYEGKYLVSNTGEIMSLQRGVPRKREIHFDKNKYLITTLHNCGVRKTYKVHRLVAIAFLGEPREGFDQVNHKDYDKQNNNVSNLEWVSVLENNIHGLITRKKSSLYLRESIEESYKSGATLKEIAISTGLKVRAIKKFLEGDTFPNFNNNKHHIPNTIPHNKKIHKEQIDQIVKMRLDGVMFKDIAKIFKVEPNTIRRNFHRQTNCKNTKGKTQ